MGTETARSQSHLIALPINVVKLNNPLMGTETAFIA